MLEPSDRSQVTDIVKSTEEDRRGYVEMVGANTLLYLTFLVRNGLCLAKPGRIPTSAAASLKYAGGYFITTLSGSPLLPRVKIRPDQFVMHIMAFSCAFWYECCDLPPFRFNCYYSSRPRVGIFTPFTPAPAHPVIRPLPFRVLGTTYVSSVLLYFGRY
jgi:hypothetical protein